MTEYFIMLQKVLGYGSAKLPDVIKNFGDPKAFFQANKQVVTESGILSEDELKKFNNISLDYAGKIMQNCLKTGCRPVTPDMDEYPRALFNIIDPPCVIYVKGKLPCFDEEVSVSMVGSRHPTDTGIRSAASLAARLARAGAVIVSGGAYGIDRVSHYGALAAGGVTACVMPCGVNVNYPAGNREMRQEILADGCLISEFVPGSPVSVGAFHIRNRIISALSLACVIIEAGERSGTIITAGRAIDQGRDVFVVPGPVDVEQYKGSNKLISDGARPLLSAGDILEEYAAAYPHKLNIRNASEPFSKEILHRLSVIIPGKTTGNNAQSKTVEHNAQSKNVKVKASAEQTEALRETPKEQNHVKRALNPGEVSSDAEKIYTAFPTAPASPDYFVTECKMDGGTVLAALTELEIFGYVESLPGGRCKLAD